MKILTLSHFTAYWRNGQLVLSMNSEFLLPESSPVQLTRLQLEKLDYSKLYAAYSSKGRKSKVAPSVLFQVIAYAYQCGIYSSRKIEEACRYRVDFIWLLDGQKAPNHATIARFRTDRYKEMHWRISGNLLNGRAARLSPLLGIAVKITVAAPAEMPAVMQRIWINLRRLGCRKLSGRSVCAVSQKNIMTEHGSM